MASCIIVYSQPFADSSYIHLAQYYSRGDTALMPCPGNDLDIIPSGKQKWAFLLADLEAAQHTICMEYYRWKNDDAGNQVRDVIIRKLREGVEVKILIEDMANAFYLKEYYLELRREGAQLQFFTDTDRQLWQTLPGINIRDHRKIVIIDGKVGYVGGMNLSSFNRDIWMDTHLRIQGPAVASLAKLFDDMWLARKGPELKRHESKAAVRHENAGFEAAEAPGCGFTPGQFHDKTVQFATSGGGDNLLEEGLCRILRGATRYVYFQTPYYCPSDTLLAAFRQAAQRGVDIRILVPEEADIRLMTEANASYFAESIGEGVHILVRPGTFDHSKTVVADDCLAIIGSMNLDRRSLSINHESIALIYDRDVAGACRDLFFSRAADAHEITADNIAALPKNKLRSQKFWRRHSGLL